MTVTVLAAVWAVWTSLCTDHAVDLSAVAGIALGAGIGLGLVLTAVALVLRHRA